MRPVVAGYSIVKDPLRCRSSLAREFRASSIHSWRPPCRIRQNTCTSGRHGFVESTLERLFCRPRSWGSPASSGDSYGPIPLHPPLAGATLGVGPHLSVWLCWAAPGGRGHERGSGSCEDRGSRGADRGLTSSLSRFRFPFSVHTGTLCRRGIDLPGRCGRRQGCPGNSVSVGKCSRAFWVGQVGFWGLALAGGDWRFLLVSGGFCALVFGGSW